jgi:putative methanogen marker protein 4
MMTSDLLLSQIQRRGLRIGIGTAVDDRKVKLSCDQAEPLGLGEILIYRDAQRLAEDLREGGLDAAVRGDMDSNEAMTALRAAFGVTKVLRAAFLEPPRGSMFLLAPVGIDEGWTVEEKIELARLGAGVLRRLGVCPVVGIMSGGRSSDRGRIVAVDRTLDDAALVVRRLREEGIDARDVQMLIESAVRECDVLIAPDGISGNLIFRTLHFLGGGKALGAPVLNIPSTYIDTSRAKESYVDSIILAAALSRRGTR